MSKIGVLLVNLGTPDAPTRGAVYRYLKQFLLDGRVIDFPWLPRNILVRGIIAPFRSGSSSKLYKKLWTPEGSPLKVYGYKVEKAVQESLGDGYLVKLAMRYQTPSVKSGIDALLQAKVDKIVIFPMFPQYASASTGSVHEEVMRLLSKEQTIPDLKFISSYHDHPSIIKVFAENAKKYDLDSYDHFLFSFHGLPERQLKKGDDFNHCLKKENCCQSLCPENRLCYSAQCHDTAFKIAEYLEIPREKFTVSYQSRLGNDPWVKPYTIKVLEEAAKEKGYKNILVFSPAFVSDCLETTIEISDEYQEEFEEWGGHKLDLVESLNDNPAWVDAIVEMVR